MQEAFLHFIWKYKYFNSPQLQTVDGKAITVLKTGIHNHDSGPDFLHAQILINETRWAGHVEIHVKTSDWNLHNHSADDAYKNVILHIVYIDDRKNASDEPNIPVLELKNYIPESAYRQYEHLLSNNKWVACANSLAEVDESIKNFWLERVLIDRLEQKSDLIEEILERNKNNWEQTAFIWLARSFGFKTNASGFEELAQIAPYLLLQKHRNNLFQVESLLLGQAGFLNVGFEDDYPQKLKKEYDFLQKKYNLQPMQSHVWKFMRMHPPNFPTIKIAQFAALAHKNHHLLSQLLKLQTAADALYLFDFEASEYWKTHFVLGKTSAKQHKPVLGSEAKYNLVINAVVPLMYSYGKLKQNNEFKHNAIELLEQIPPEKNHILRGWKMLGFTAENAGQGQALIQLKNIYCNAKKCLSCGIGTAILRKNKN